MERKTRQREAILGALEQSIGPLSPSEILESSQEQLPGIGIATIYRNVKSFVDEGKVDAVKIPGEPDRYEISGKPHHHHFICKRCNRVFEARGCPGQFDSMAPVGFHVDGHEVFLYGRCETCLKGHP